MKRTITFAAITLTSALALAACGEGTETQNTDTATTTTTAEETTTEATADTTAETTTEAAGEISAQHNDADIMFAQMMIPHHQQAVEMSEMLLAKDNIPTEVAGFAQGVIDAQGPEIERMNTMLETWGAEPGGMGDMEGMDHGSGSGMSGMMSEEDMAALEAAQGTEAARLYLEQMIAHHEGAVDMAEQHLQDGENPQALELSETIIATQNQEIDDMDRMLDQL